MATKIKNLKRKVLALLPKRISLVYVDYRDEISDYDAINEAIQSNDYMPLYDQVDEWISDSQWDSIDYYKKETLLPEIMNEFDMDETEAEEVIEKYDDYIRDRLYDADDSTPIDDLLRNTGEITMFYDTGEDDLPGYGESEATYRLARMRIKKLFGINSAKFDNDIDELMANASYGGRLVIYFREYVGEMIQPHDKPDWNLIEFKDAHIAIINNLNGSGHDVYIPGHSFSLPFQRKNLFVEKCTHYSYVYEVCGMVESWCKETQVTFHNVENPGELKGSSLTKHLEREKELNETYKKGGCTFGDMNIKRHRETPYRIEFPAGNKCTKCGTFWID